MASARPPLDSQQAKSEPTPAIKAPRTTAETEPRPPRGLTLIEGTHRGESDSPDSRPESYRVEDALTDADKQMIDFLIDKALEAWRRSR